MSQDYKIELIAKAKELTWKHWLERPYGPLMAQLVFAGVDKKYFDQTVMQGLGFRAHLYQFPDLYYAAEIEVANDQALEKYFENHTIFDISKNVQQVHQRNKKQVASLIKNKKLTPIAKLVEMREILRSYHPFLFAIMSLENYFNRQIAEQVPKYIKTDIDKFIGDASVPKKKNAYGKMLELLNSDTPIEQVHQKFAWLKNRDGFTDFYTIKELEEIRKNIQPEAKHQVRIPKELKNLFVQVQELVFFRTERTDKYYEIMGLMRPLFQEIAAHFDVSLWGLANCNADSLIDNGIVELVAKPFSYLYVDGEQMIQNEPIIKIDNAAQQSEIKGIIAFKGVVRGTAKIVCHSNEVNKVQFGDILVSQMTFPSYISALQKAVAFVTDEGGITCHAAIVAREMKKPCVIATKIATKVLHDGDLIEVDADHGVVRILEKAK